MQYLSKFLWHSSMGKKKIKPKVHMEAQKSQIAK
jgi:hypothetical protein